MCFCPVFEYIFNRNGVTTIIGLGQAQLGYEDTYEEGTYSLTPYTVEKQGENYYLLMKGEDKYTKDPDGADLEEPVINNYWEVVKINSNGVRQWDGQSRTERIAGFEHIFKEDIDGDGEQASKWVISNWDTETGDH